MATTFTWSVSSLNRHLPDGIVYTVHWRASAEQDGTTVGIYGADSLPAPEGEVIPYEDLTEEIVVGWLHGLEDFDKDGKEASLQSQLDKKLNPVSESGVPW